MKTKDLFVVVTAISADLHSYDEDVPGTYAVKGMPADTPDNVACERALDSFHENIPISVLEDFEIAVKDPLTDKELESDSPDYEGYILPCTKLNEGQILKYKERAQRRLAQDEESGPSL